MLRHTHMETPAKAALGGGLISTLAIGGIVAAGVLATSAAVVLTDPAAPAASATGLVPFEELRARCAAGTSTTPLDEVGPWGWGGRMWPMAMEDSVARESTTMGSAATPGSRTGRPAPTPRRPTSTSPTWPRPTGGSSYASQDGRRLVITDVTGSEPRELADWALPTAAYADGLLLVGDHVLLGSSAPGRWAARARTFPQSGAHRGLRRRHLRPHRPAPGRHRVVVGAAALDAAVRRHGPPGHLDRAARAAVRPAGRRRQRERGGPPQPRDRAVHTHRGLDPGARLRRGLPPGPVDRRRSTVAVSTFRPGSLDDADPGRGLGGGQRGLLLDRPALRDGDRHGPPSDAAGRARHDHASDLVPRDVKVRTNIHAFALDGDTTRYVASGVVDGRIRDRWSLDEHDGHLRVAVAWPSRQGATRDNGVVVLDERDGRLEEVGRPRRPRDRRGDPVGALVRRPGRRGHLPADGPALHDRPLRPDPAASTRRAEDPGLLGVPPPDRRRPAARARQRRDRPTARTSAPRRPSSTSATRRRPARSTR